MKKNALAIILCLVLALTVLCGCAGSPATKSAYDSSAATAEAPAADMAAPEEYAYTEQSEYNGTSLASGLLPEPQTASLSADKIIYTANAELETQEFDKTLTAISDLLAQYSGFVESSSVSGSDYYTLKNEGGVYRRADYSLRIPAEGFAEFCDGVKALGNVPSFSTSAENVTSQYTDIDARLTARKTEEARLLELLGKAQNVDEMLSVESALADVRCEIESLQSQLNSYDALVSYSTLYLNVREVTLYTSVDDATKSYGAQLSDGFADNLKAVGQFFADFFKWFVSSLPVILILAAVGVGIFFLVRHIVRKQKAKKAEAQKPKEDDK